jgi:hypothetical protein|tara:strand:- start:823 stop:1209 length:387 start_codon:yes stop_codon:yes gene_type:complete
MPRKKLEDLDKPTATPTPAVTKPDAVVVATQDSTTRKVKLDLEVDTSVKDLGPNPYVKLIHMARAVDSWRIFPRIFITVYIILLYQVVHWYMNLGTSATMEQSGLVSVVVGAGAAWFGLYTGSSKNRK